MSKFQEVSDQISEFSDRKFGTDRPFTAPLHHLQKEVKECIESDGDIYEFADIQLLLLDAFRKRYPDFNTNTLLDICVEKIAACEKRKWGKSDENGVIEHIRDLVS